MDELGCPMELAKTRQVSLLRLAQKAQRSFGCPIAFQKTQQVEFLPKGRAQQCKQTDETVAPATDKGAKAQQHLHQQRRPDLPAHGVGIVSQEIGQLQTLFKLFKKYFD